MLKPIDIQKKEFEHKLRGYSTEQVDDFLDKIIHDYELLIKENQGLKEKLEETENKLKGYKSIEKTLDEAVIISRETASGIISNAKLESENIIRRARLDAKKLERQIDEEHTKKQQEIIQLNTELDAYKVRLKSICGSIVEMADKI